MRLVVYILLLQGSWYIHGHRRGKMTAGPPRPQHPRPAQHARRHHGHRRRVHLAGGCLGRYHDAAWLPAAHRPRGPGRVVPAPARDAPARRFAGSTSAGARSDDLPPDPLVRAAEAHGWWSACRSRVLSRALSPGRRMARACAAEGTASLAGRLSRVSMPMDARCRMAVAFQRSSAVAQHALCSTL